MPGGHCGYGKVRRRRCGAAGGGGRAGERGQRPEWRRRHEARGCALEFTDGERTGRGDVCDRDEAHRGGLRGGKMWRWPKRRKPSGKHCRRERRDRGGLGWRGKRRKPSGKHCRRERRDRGGLGRGGTGGGTRSVQVVQKNGTKRNRATHKKALCEEKKRAHARRGRAWTAQWAHDLLLL